MALRYHGTNLAIGTGGSLITHGITNPQGTAAAPTAWYFNFADAASTVDANLYRLGAPSTTQFGVAVTTRNATAVDVFCMLPHSIISGL
jgi:hypothetical protein